MAEFNPQALRLIANGLRAQSQLQALETGPQMRQAINQMETPYGEVQGTGFAAQAPSILNMLATTAMQRQGQAKVRGLDARADALRGQIADSALAQQQEAFRREELAQQARARQAEAANQTRMDVAGLNAATRLQAAKIAAEAATAAADRRASDAEAAALRRAKEKAEADARRSEEKRLDREMKERIAKARASTGLKPTASQVNEYAAADATLATLKELRAMVANASPKVKQDIDRPLKHTLVDMIPGEGFKRMVENATTETPEAKAYYSMLYQMGGRLTKEMTGLSGTKYEAKDRQRWSPAALGIDQAERERRIDDIANHVSKFKKEMQTFYPAHFGGRENIDIGEQEPTVRELDAAERAEGTDPLTQAKRMLSQGKNAAKSDKKKKDISEMTLEEINAELGVK